MVRVLTKLYFDVKESFRNITESLPQQVIGEWEITPQGQGPEEE
jgi:hypothetical protein